MKPVKRTVLIIAAAAAVVAVAVAAVLLLWKPEPKGIVVGVSTLPDSLNPVLAQNASGLNADELVFDGLVNFEVDAQSGKLYSEMALADRIDQDPRTKKTYRVALKQVSWHDGTPLTAEDVEYSFAAYCEPANESPHRDYLMSFIESVTAVDERTVEVEFASPIPPFRAYPVLTFKIIPATYRGRKMAVNLRAGENERTFAVEPIGTGPFKLAGWEIGKWVNFTANPAYFKANPQAASLVIKKIIDPVIRMNELRQGRINLVLETSPLDRPQVEKIPNVDINWYLPYSFYQVAINTTSPLFTDADARVAMSMALDRGDPGPLDHRQRGGSRAERGSVPRGHLFQQHPRIRRRADAGLRAAGCRAGTAPRANRGNRREDRHPPVPRLPRRFRRRRWPRASRPSSRRSD